VSLRRSELESEHNIYKQLSGCYDVPKVHWFGTELDHCALVIDLLGPSLEDIFGQCQHKFSLKTVLHVASQLASEVFNHCIFILTVSTDLCGRIDTFSWLYPS
jgi:hypothetical protein